VPARPVGLYRTTLGFIITIVSSLSGSVEYKACSVKPGETNSRRGNSGGSWLASDRSFNMPSALSFCLSKINAGTEVALRA